MRNFIELAQKLFGTTYSDFIPPVWKFIESSYQQPWRYYHTLDHIHRSLREFENIEKLLNFPDTIELAIWLHDVVYIPGSKLNERMSGDAAFLICKQFLYSPQDGLRKLIVGHPDSTYRNDWKYFRDTDYSIMAEKPEIYDEYVTGVYSEFLPIYSRQDIQHYRGMFLTKLKRKVFLTEYFRDLYEAQALLNIKRELLRIAVATRNSKLLKDNH